MRIQTILLYTGFVFWLFGTPPSTLGRTNIINREIALPASIYGLDPNAILHCGRGEGCCGKLLCFSREGGSTGEDRHGNGTDDGSGRGGRMGVCRGKPFYRKWFVHRALRDAVEKRLRLRSKRREVCHCTAVLYRQQSVVVMVCWTTAALLIARPVAVAIEQPAVQSLVDPYTTGIAAAVPCTGPGPCVHTANLPMMPLLPELTFFHGLFFLSFLCVLFPSNYPTSCPFPPFPDHLRKSPRPRNIHHPPAARLHLRAQGSLRCRPLLARNRWRRRRMPKHLHTRTTGRPCQKQPHYQ